MVITLRAFAKSLSPIEGAPYKEGWGRRGGRLGRALRGITDRYGPGGMGTGRRHRNGGYRSEWERGKGVGIREGGNVGGGEG